MRVTPARDASPLSYAFLDAAVGAGYERRDDLNGRHQDGACWTYLNIIDGSRQSAADGYLRPVLDRANLTVVTGALARRLVVADGRCAGVEYSADSQVRQACPSGETILSSGPIGSAQLLMLSGIGPAEHLRAVGVDVVADLPGVRANLQDHPLAESSTPQRSRFRPPRNKLGEVRAAVRTTPGLAGPDVQVFLIDMPFHPPSMPGPAAGYTIAFTTLHPHSRGSVQLADADPSSAPLIETPTQSGHVRAHIATRIARVLSVMRGA